MSEPLLPNLPQDLSGPPQPKHIRETEASQRDLSVPVPKENLPRGVGPAWFDPSIMRFLAERHNEAFVPEPVEVKPWVLLTLLDAYEAQAAKSNLEAAADYLTEWIPRSDQRIREHMLWLAEHVIQVARQTGKDADDAR